MKNGLLLIVLFFVFGMRSSNAEVSATHPILSQTHQQVPKGFKEEWGICSSDEDCIVEPLPCSSIWLPLNKEYAKDFLEKFGTPETSNCSSSPDFVLPPVTLCVNKMCQLTDKPKNSSYYEWRKENPLE